MTIDLKISPPNIIKDWGNFEDWENGDSAAPTEYTLTGTGATIAKESTEVHEGIYSAKVISGSGTAELYRHVESLLDEYTGRKYTFGVWIKTSSVGKVRIQIADGVGTTSSSYHTGGGDWEFLSVTRDLDENAARLTVIISVEASSVTAYCDGCILCEGDILFTDLSNIEVEVDQFRTSNTFEFSDADIPGRMGKSIIDAKLRGKDMSLSGTIKGASAADARLIFDDLKKGLFDGPRELHLYADRLFEGYLSSFKEVPHERSTIYIEFSFNFRVDDIPASRYFNKTRVSQSVSSSPTNFTVTNNGNMPTFPVLRFIAGGTDITSLTLENLTTGEVFSFTGTVSAGNTLEIDTNAQTILNDGTDALADFSNGDFLKLVCGDNKLKFTGSNCTIKVDFFERFL